MRKLNKLVAAGVAGSLLLATASTSFALPVASNGEAVREAAPVTTTDVRWHGRWHRGWGGGVGAAALGLGIAAASAPYYYGGYYGPRYGYYDPYYGGCWRDRWGRVFCR